MSWLQVLKSKFPASQAVQELRWIQQELPRSQWQTAVEQRANLVPLQYILGSQPFGDLTIKCKPGVLIPRNDTEEWCEELKQVIKKRNGPVEVLEYCTGSGCIGLSIATLANVKKVLSLDISKEALALCQENLQLNSAKVKAEVEFHHGDLLKHQLPQTSATLLLSNPPYIPREHFNRAGGVEESVLKYEPEDALVGNLEFYSRAHQKPSPKLDLRYQIRYAQKYTERHWLETKLEYSTVYVR
ncbi:hypothetical protein KL951_005076 [Ogataea haglerorum]|nr:hypothetical protein KL951_005076 [Ogataea haglerorum]